MVSYTRLPVSISVLDFICPRHNETPASRCALLEPTSIGEEQKA